MGDAVTIAGLEEPAQAPLELEVEDEEGSNASDSDQFSEAGWLEVSKKLRDQEIKTGLTFVQRARLRKQIALGGLVDPPAIMERHGGLPDWMTRPEPSLSPRPSVQVGGSASSGSAPAPGPVLNTSDEVTAGDAGTGDPGITLLDYEDLFDEDEGLGPSCVGGFVTGQFLGVLLSIEGGCIFSYVGFEEGDVANWLTCSNSCRIAIVSAIAEQWRLLPGGIACDGHGVPMLIQEAVLRGTLRFRSPVDTLGVGCGIGLSGAGLSGLLVDHGELLVACLGLRATEWRCLACAASSLSSDPKIALILRFQDTGRESSGLVGQGWRVEFRFEMTENGSSWVPVSLLPNEGGSSFHRFDGGSSQQIPSSSSVQIGGSSSSQSFYAGSSQQIPSSSSVQIGGSSSSQSFYPGSGQQSSFSSSAQIGGSSSTSRFFDAGMAYMQADESPPGFLRHPLEEDVEDDPTIDDRPHGPVRTQVPRVLQVFREEAWSSSESGDSTTEPSVCSSSNSPAESDTLWAIRDTEARVSQSVEPPALGVMFQADPGVLVGVFGDDEVSFPLQGWSQAEVQTIVTGLNDGEWASFHAVMAIPEVTESQSFAHESVCQGITWFMVVVSGCVSLVGAFLRWWWWFIVLWWSMLVWYRSRRGFADLFGRNWGVRPRGDSRWVVFLYVLWLILGGVLPSSAEVIADDSGLDPFEIGDRLDGGSNSAGGMCLKDEQGFEGEAGSWSLCLFAACVIGTWEIGRALFFRLYRTQKTVLDKAVSAETVPWPLHPGIPHRAKILYCYWRAGYAFEVEEYPERVQSEFYDLLGSYLVRRDRDNLSSTDSSD